LVSYAGTALAFSYIIQRKKMGVYLYIHKPLAFKNIPLLILVAISAYPVAMLIYQVNMQIIPDSWKATELLDFQKYLMKMDNSSALITNIGLLGLIAGVGEELLFRGVIQRLLGQYTQSIHIAAWLTALLFSFTHFQPEGFIPRFLLGALLSYLFIWTGSLWSAIIVHVLFNSMQVILIYIESQSTLPIAMEDYVNNFNIYTVLSIIVCLLSSFLLWKWNQKQQIKTAAYIAILNPNSQV